MDSLPKPEIAKEPIWIWPLADYEEFLILLDAENLAEGCFCSIYEELIPELCKYIAQPLDVLELTRPDIPEKKILCDRQEYIIYSHDDPEGWDSWKRATYFFFLIVNKQLVGTGVQFYAIHYGNCLQGIFLSPQQAEAMRNALPQKDDWPYTPELSPPWYGRFH